MDDLAIVGGHPALDLVNTVHPRLPVPDPDARDRLPTPADLLAWAPRAALIEPTEVDAVAAAWAADPAAAQAALDATIQVREALYATLLAATGGGPAGGALERLHVRWVAAAGRSRLVLDPHARPPVRLATGLVPALLIPDRAATAAVDLLATADFDRLRQCPLERGGCGWLFLDRSRNGSRQWCAMADCGAHAKARRLTERRRLTRERG